MSFVNLHAHSHYSLLDGFGSPLEIVKRAKELGYPAAALTDHGVVYGLLEFYKAAKSEGIKPILGCELYVAPRTRFDKDPKLDRKPYHLTALAKNKTGYENLLKMTSKAHLEGFYYKPRVDYDLLRECSEGLIVLSGCISAHLPRLVLAGNDTEVHKLVKQFIDIFGKENYFLELQDNPLFENQQIVNEKLKELAKEYGLDMVLTFDSHYPRPEDSDVHDILLCIQTGSNVNDENRMKYHGDFSIRNVEEIKERFADCPEIFENTVKIADMCDIEFDFGTNLIPSYETPDGKSAEAYLRELCEIGLKKKFEDSAIPEGYPERLDFELKTVNSMGFDTYFLIVEDFVNYAKDQGIVVGPGRGSAAGSIIAWTLGITDLDPIHYGLFFERFLNPERVSMPDIDIDFADNRREEVLNYVVAKYGRERVAQIITFGTMAARAAVRDAGRALGVPYGEVDAISKTIPPPILGKHTPLKLSVKDDAGLRSLYEKNPVAKRVLDYAIRLEGTVRHVGTHACAVVISEKDLTNYTALQFGSSGNGEIVTQFSAKPLEDLGLLKMDFLGLRNLTVIETTQKIVKRTRDEDVDVNSVPLDDKETFELLQRGETTGVFQLESGGMRRYLKELKPTQFDDIVAMGALYRPGPMEWIPTYIKGKHDPASVKYLDESFKEILEPTYGVAVYQEQILQLARDFAGFSLGEADILRKAVGKKDPRLLAEQREKFIDGAVAEGHKKSFAKEVFEKVVEPFAGYGFNKAHAACYGMIAYQTAYLKAHYLIEFMTALLCSDANNMDRVVLEVQECIERGIEVLSPSVNESFMNFTVVDNNKIRFGILAIKGVGEGPIKEIISARESGGAFKSIEDFAKRVPTSVVNKKLIQALALSGAFDEFGERNQIAESFAEISKYAKQIQASVSSDQTDIFGMLGDEVEAAALKLQDVPPFTKLESLKWEKELLGMYVSGHPLRGLRQYISRKASLIGNLKKKQVGKTLKLLGAIGNLRKITTKNGGNMATFVIEDPSGKVNAVMFPRTFAKIGAELIEDMVVGISGKLDNKRGGYQLIAENAKSLSLNVMIENAREADIYTPDDKSDIAIRFLDDILKEEEEADLESYSIVIPAGAKPDVMKNLRTLLEKNHGDTVIELDLQSMKKRVKLPFGVNLTDDLKKMIDSLLVS
jgi:DNA polymerase III subunit alpha